jgi:hypothetical protein
MLRSLQVGTGVLWCWARTDDFCSSAREEGEGGAGEGFGTLGVCLLLEDCLTSFITPVHGPLSSGS